jgi:LmbE family N-acetylglucosaminyl deacetylase
VNPLFLGAGETTPYKALAIGAHADDIEVGCGGTILRLIQAGVLLEICWVVLSADSEREAEARASARAFVSGVESQRFIAGGFRNGFLPYGGGEVKDFFESLKTEFVPDVIFTHQRADLHQDHRLTSELTWNTFRDHLILEYEVPKYDGDLGAPNMFVELSESLCRRKIEQLLEHFSSQREKRWFREELFRGLLRLRGMECNAQSTYAEAFYCRKALLAP